MMGSHAYVGWRYCRETVDFAEVLSGILLPISWRVLHLFSDATGSGSSWFEA